MQASTEMVENPAAGFAALLGEHQRLVYRIATSYAPSRADVDALAQEIATQAWRSFRTYDPQRRFSTWSRASGSS